MFTSHLRPLGDRAGQMAALLAATCLMVLAVGATATASPSTTAATASRGALHAALAKRAAAHRALAASSKRLERCLRVHPRRCWAAKRAARRARRRLARAERRANRLAAQLARASRQSTSKQAPTLTVSGEALSWNAVGSVSSYVLARKVPGHSTQYSVIEGTSATPSAVPGTTVSYAVRANVKGGAWSNEVSIAYPAEPAPTTSSSGTTSGSTSTSTTSTSTSTSTTSSSEPVSTTTGTTSTSPETTTVNPFEMGIVAGSALSYELPFIQKLGAHTARMEFDIGTPASQLAPVIEEYARAGIRPLLLASFYGTLPSSTEASNLAGWAAEFGPGGNFWKGKTFPAGTAVTDIEFGNETSYSYQFSTNTLSAIQSRAQTYALRYKEAYEAIHASNPNVGLLAQGDPGNDGAEWALNMFKAVPNLGQMVAGWTVHPYGPGWKTVMDNVISFTQAAGAPSSIPLYVTEWGLASDNGKCLDGNYGWNACMTYAEASTTLSSTVSAMRSTYGSRLASLYVYQAHDQSATGTTTSFGHYFGALQSNGEAKGAYTTTVESLLSSNP
jgi:hypothetical protein